MVKNLFIKYKNDNALKNLIMTERNNLERTRQSNNQIKKQEYIHIDIYKDENCFFRPVSVYLSDTQENYSIIREMISQYADANREQFKEFFINDNVDEVLYSLELNTYIDNIKRDGEYAGIIELSIASKIPYFA